MSFLDKTLQSPARVVVFFYHFVDQKTDGNNVDIAYISCKQFQLKLL